jgi:nucleoside-diphosphate-sugar epimerase|tara:strand:- start:470 stop:1375 length:906 start_codon:yes stop_codon:yes gene_type:complete
MNYKNFENILIVGARGNSAYFFLRELEKNNIKSKISVISRDKSKNNYFDQFKLNLKIFNGDINDKVFFEKCLKNIDTILHTANMENSESIVNVASKKVKWIILVHSTMIYSKNLSPFIKNRIRIDDKIKKKFNNITILRPTMIYGNHRDINFSKLIKFIDKFKIFPIIGNGQNLIQPIFVNDLSKAYFDLIKNKDKTFNKNYNLAGKNSLKYADLLKLIEKEFKKKIFSFKIPIVLAIILVNFLKIISFGKFPLNSSQIKRQSEDKIFNINDAINDFNFSPRSIEDGLKEQISSYLVLKNK